jgi:hypothetical protein
MKKRTKLILSIAICISALTACSLQSAVHLSESYDNTFTTTYQTLTVPPTALTVTLSGTASVNATNTLYIFVLDPNGNNVPTPLSITGNGTGGSEKVSGSWPAEPGSWTLRVSAVGASGSFDLVLQYQ